MIELTFINGNAFVLNANLIETVESIPETKVTLTNGKFYLVLETKAEVIDKVVEYNKRVFFNKVAFKK